MYPKVWFLEKIQRGMKRSMDEEEWHQQSRRGLSWMECGDGGALCIDFSSCE